jgi:hypothetical protein
MVGNYNCLKTCIYLSQKVSYLKKKNQHGIKRAEVPDVAKAVKGTSGNSRCFVLAAVLVEVLMLVVGVMASLRGLLGVLASGSWLLVLLSPCLHICSLTLACGGCRN